MDRIHVESSNIESIGYDNESETLEIEFLNGSIYQYFDFPVHLYQEFLAADSQGKFLANEIKGNFRFSKV